MTSRQLSEDVHLAIDQVLVDKRIAVVFASNFKTRVRVTRKWPNSVKDLVVTIGRLNYKEVAYVKLCKKAGTKPSKMWFPTR